MKFGFQFKWEEIEIMSLSFLIKEESFVLLCHSEGA